MKTVKISLTDIPNAMNVGDPIACTVNGVQHDAEFVSYGADTRFITVRIHGIREIEFGHLTEQLEMFGDNFIVDDFVVNDALGQPWHRTAGTTYWID